MKPRVIDRAEERRENYIHHLKENGFAHEHAEKIVDHLINLNKGRRLNELKQSIDATHDSNYVAHLKDAAKLAFLISELQHVTEFNTRTGAITALRAKLDVEPTSSPMGSKIWIVGHRNEDIKRVLADIKNNNYSPTEKHTENMNKFIDDVMKRPLTKDEQDYFFLDFEHYNDRTPETLNHAKMHRAVLTVFSDITGTNLAMKHYKHQRSLIKKMLLNSGLHEEEAEKALGPFTIPLIKKFQ